MGKIKPKECQNVEYKRSWQDEYLKWVCGFANAQGAVMYFGVDDDHEVVGLKQTEKLLEDIPNKIVNAMGIVVDVNLREQDGLEYIEAVIEPSNVPISYKGKYYYRSGSTMQELTGPALTDFLMRKLNVTWDATTVPAATLKDIDRSAVKYFLNAAIEEGRIGASARKDSMEQLLRKLHLIDEKSGLLTMAALLLFGKDVERWNLSVAFRIGRFGYSDADLILQDRIVCPLIMMPDLVIDTLRTKYLVSPIHYEGLRRKEPLEIPEDALREMVCNSIVHKNYTGTFTQMRVYGDSITLWNDGTLPANFTIKTLFKRHESRPRNKLIANVFYLAGFIEAWGRGYEKIHDAFKAENLEMPVFEEVRGGFMATVKRERFLAIQKRHDVTSNVTGDVVSNVVSDVVSDVSSLSVVQLSKRQKDIAKLISKKPFISAQQLSVVLSVVQRTIQRDLSAMQKMGVLVREGNTSAGHWVLLSDKTV